MSIKRWPEKERPREKLLAYGAECLSDSELLAIFLRIGIRGKTAVDLARDLLADFNGLQNLFEANVEMFCSKPGMGPAKYVQLQAVLELSRRYFYEEIKENVFLHGSEATKHYLLAKIGHLRKEVFMGIFLNSKNKVIASKELFRGTLNHTVIYPREIVAEALRYNAAAVIFAHNHPSGDPTPSKQDIKLTREMQMALATVEVKVLDHFIVGRGEVVSLLG